MKPNLEFPGRERLEELLLESRTRTLSTVEREQLNAILRADDAARAFAAQTLMDDASLAEELRAEQMESLFAANSGGMLGASQHAPAVTRRVWFQWRPLTAAAAGIVVGMLCTSVVWAVVSPHVLPVVSHVLALANAGFEESVAPAPDGVPVRYALWSGDFAEIVEAQQGIMPREGRRMLRFLRADSSASTEPEKNVTGNLYQVVDMHPYRNEFADGQASVDWSAWFNWVPGDGEKGMKFMTSVWAFKGDTSILPVNWKDHLYLETAKNSHTIEVDDATKTWRQLAGRMIVPPDTDFLVIELKVIPNPPAPGTPPYRFSGCFADDVRLTLRTPARQQPLAQNSATK